MLAAGFPAPSFALADAETGVPVSDPWTEGPTILVFFKVTCPVCHMVAPKVTALAAGGARVVAIGEDPPPALRRYARERDQRVTTLSEPAPYPVSSAYDIASVPSLYLVDGQGTVVDAVGGWDRERWNAVAAAAGSRAPISTDDDGLPTFRPG